MRDKINFEYLLHRHLSGELTDEERARLLEALNDKDDNTSLSDLVNEYFSQPQPPDYRYDKAKVDGMVRHILKKDVQSAAEEPIAAKLADETDRALPGVDRQGAGGKVRRISPWWSRTVAAAAIAGSLLFFYNRFLQDKSIEQTTQLTAVQQENDVLPGSNKAILTLSDGNVVELDGTGGQLIKDGEIAIENKGGKLVYDQSESVVYNTMSTPRGGQFKLQLSDGTAVWLNAASSITYPSSFLGKIREVRITGEVYFEVAKNAAKPFIVKTYSDEITVKGTSFNVNSYADEPGVKTSLLEGLVEINGRVLTPGNAYRNGTISETEIDRDLAWKNGVFNFHQVKLKDAMKQIARWYDVELRYSGGTGDVLLGGEIGRNLTLQQVLSGLQDKDIHFRLEGKTLTVY